jgi:hypothetical protein
MSTDWVEKEREFLSSLEADTGRDLGEWLALIRAQQLPHRNDIIDWLRQQGFTFSRASWIERIHNNGGRPIYLDPADLLATRSPTPRVAAQSPAPARVPTPPAPSPALPAPPDTTHAPTPPPAPLQVPLAVAPATATAPPAPVRQEPVLPASLPIELDAVLAAAKAYRPLAQYVLREIQVVLPGTVMRPHPGCVALANPRVFAVLAISSKDLRLGLDLGAAPVAGPLERARFSTAITRAAGEPTHMVVLTDARQVDDSLLALVQAASRRVNG